MAQIKSFRKITRKIQSQVVIDATYSIASISGNKLFQINTWGSEDRKIKGQASQTIQFNEESARELVRILQDEYGI
ncbi:hypothetical protein [Paenibacillus roseipurpureus]|uniref:Methionyl-tRNA formyltransferase n=1 Tax=Paenibacillus roseopurpureus TaxID=2918901 RepID=A0AA96LN96_9BACL|nr:hypothetical protein [Paenibacillus sp. MBLB1832]WNR45122.1 hypothetical protein MJB10_02935 [Paenibacillus sp. MBLB1832]